MMTRRPRRSASALLLAGLLILLSQLAATCFESSSRLSTDGGWTKVGPEWPLSERNYFVATEKGHHFIELDDLPRQLESDLEVTLEYYYSYKRAKPVIQMIPCRSNFFLLDEISGHQHQISNTWILHKILVSRADCETRNVLAYNVLLHDPGDVFAWRRMTVKSVPERAKEEEGPKKANNADEKQEEEEPKGGSKPTSSGGSGSGGGGDDDDDISKLIDSEMGPPAGKRETNESAVVPPPASDGADSSEVNTTPQASLADMVGSQLQELMKKMDSTAIELQKAREEFAGKPAKSEEMQVEGRELPDEGAPAHRYKRAAAKEKTKSQGPVKLDEVCQPSSCDRSKFSMARFSALVNSVPKVQPDIKLEAGTHKYYLNLKDRPLILKLDSTRKLNEVDPCISGKLYMEMDAELELLIEEPANLSSNNNNNSSNNNTAAAAAKETLRLLETIRRKPNDAATAKWITLNRCISDYMPKLAERPEFENFVKFYLRPKPRAGQSANLMALLLDARAGQAGYLRLLHPIQSHLPDIRRIANVSTLHRFWIFGAAGASDKWSTPGLRLEGELGAADRKLRIDGIQADEDTLDITSRWLAIKEAELLEQPVLFVYRAKPEDWVRRVEFQYQREGDRPDDWISQLAYAAPESRDLPEDAAAAAAEPAPNNASQAEGAKQKEKQALASRRLPPIELPIRLRGIDSSNFRVRLRHHLEPLSKNLWRERFARRSLQVGALAFADACSYRPQYCFNGGQCRPTGAAQAECVCLRGFSGAYCEHKHPCQMVYANGETGARLCSMLGARCVEGLPVMRCEWPNDQYFRCQKLYKLDSSGRLDSNSGGPGGGENQAGSGDGGDEQAGGKKAEDGGKSGTPDSSQLESLPSEQQVELLKGLVSKQAKMVIVLAVFIISIVIFALVLVGSLVSRLRRSSRRLKRAQSDMQQMARRLSAGPGNGSVVSTSFGRASGAKAVGYNNSSFDLE